MSYNTLFGGFDGGDDRRYRSQLDIISACDPDILMIQEAKGFLADGSRILHATEHHLGRRGFVAPAPITGQNTAVFIKLDIVPLSFEADGAHFHHAAAVARLLVPGFSKPVTAISVHLCPNSPAAREREISYLFGYADPDALAIVAGDFNSVSPDDPEPAGLSALPTRHQMRYAAPSGQADRSTLAALYRAGFVDIALSHSPGGAPATVPAAGFADTEFMPFRSDYMLASQGLAKCSRAYGVIDDERTAHASDHYPIWADFESLP